MHKINYKKSSFLSKINNECLSDDFIFDEYIKSRNEIKKTVNINVSNMYENLLFFIGLDEQGNYYQINNITKTKQMINNIKEYFDKCYENVPKNIFNIPNLNLSNYRNDNNNLHFTIIPTDICLTVTKRELDKNTKQIYDMFILNNTHTTYITNKNLIYINHCKDINFFDLINNLSKIAKENSIIVYGLVNNDDLEQINNTYYSTNCFTTCTKKYGTFLRECIFNIDKSIHHMCNIYDIYGLCSIINDRCMEINNVFVLINNYLRGYDNVNSHTKFHKCVYYECIKNSKFRDANKIFSRFITRYLNPSSIKLFLFDNQINFNDFENEIKKISNRDTKDDIFQIFQIGDNKFDVPISNIRNEFLIYNFCSLSNMFENNYVFNNIFFNALHPTYQSDKYEWHMIIPYNNRLDNLTYLIKNIEQNIIPYVKIIITVVEIDYTNTLKNENFYNKINYIWIDKKRLGNHFNKCLCANVAHKIVSQICSYKYILWHDVDCVVTSNFVNEINKKINTCKTDTLVAIHTFPRRFILYTNEELAHKIRNDKINVDEIKINTDGIKIHQNEAPGGSILINTNLFEDIGMFNTSVFYDHSPEDNFILVMLQKYGTYYVVDSNNNFMVHLWHK
jgi:hypothetical protein